MIQGFNDAVCLMGDHNVVRRPEERKECRLKPIRVADFNTFNRNNELQEENQGGRRFTWVNQDRLRMSKLDRFLFNKKILG